MNHGKKFFSTTILLLSFENLQFIMIIFHCCTCSLELSSLTYSFLGFIICFQGFAQGFLILEVSSAIAINSPHNVSSDLDLRTYNRYFSLPCISHFASLLQNNLIAWKGRPWYLYLETKRALNLLLLLFIIISNKSHLQYIIWNVKFQTLLIAFYARIFELFGAESDHFWLTSTNYVFQVWHTHHFLHCKLPV